MSSVRSSDESSGASEASEEPEAIARSTAAERGGEGEPLIDDNPDEHRTGITVIEPTWLGGVGIDVIAVHGLCGHSRKTWAMMDDRLWLHEAFSEEENMAARVIMFGYDPEDSSRSCYTLRGIYEMAGELLSKLLELRNDEIRDARRPIIFVSHDIGGLIVKASLILARHDKAKHADVLRSTRTLVHFGYPHRPLSDADLEEQLFRLLSLRPGPSPPGCTARQVRSLSETVTELNEAFIHTRMLTQTILVNVCSSHPESSQSVFNEFTCMLGVDGEFQLSRNQPHLQLPLGTSTTDHPLQGKPDSDWLGGDYSQEELDRLMRLLDQTPPPYSMLHAENLLDGAGEIRKLLDPATGNHIVHVRCGSRADLISQEVFYAIDSMKELWQFQFCFRFDSQDARSSSLEPWLASIMAHAAYNRVSTMDMRASVVSVGDYYPWTTDELSACWEYVRSLNAMSDAVYMLGCFDECDESQALWLVSQIQEGMRATDGGLKVVIVTTKGTEKGERIAGALARMPKQTVTTVDCSGPQIANNTTQVGFALALLCQDDPRYSDEKIEQDVQRLLTLCREDGDLSHLLIETLKSSPDHLQAMQLFESEMPARDQIFEAALGAVPLETRSRAFELLNWLLTSRRPLRVFEFVTLCRLLERARGPVTSHRWLPRGHPQMRYEARKLLQPLGSLFRIRHDEIHFSHPELRSWLISRGQAPTPDDQQFCLKSEGERHAHVLDACLAWLKHLSGDQDTDAVFAYATGEWTHHYRLAGREYRGQVLNDVFGDQQALDNWIAAYRCLSAPFVKPRPGASRPLPIAAHFGLDDIITALLAEPGVDPEAWKEAMLECVRMGHLSTLRLVYAAAPSALDFDSEDLQEIAKAAAVSGHSDILRNIVEWIPRPTHDKPDWRSMKTRVETNDATVTGEGGLPTEDDQHPEEPSNDLIPRTQPTPFDWLGFILFHAAKYGLDDVIDRLLSLGADLNTSVIREKKRRSALAIACRRRQLSAARALLGAGAYIDQESGPYIDPPLRMAAAGGNTEIVKLLLQERVAVDSRSDDDLMPIHVASYWGPYDVVEVLLQHKPLGEYKVPAASPLPFTVSRGRYQTLKILLESGIDPNGADEKGTALWHAVREDRLDICKLLLSNKADPDFTPEGSTPPLVQAVKDENLNMIKLLLAQGADIQKTETREGLKRTPLATAILDNQVDIVRYLLEKGADPLVGDEDNWTPVWTAANYGYTEIVRLLCKSGAKPTINTPCGRHSWTPLHTASEYPDTVQVLLEFGADPSGHVGASRTPLAHAIRNRHTETIRHLLYNSTQKPDLHHSSVQGELLFAARWVENCREILDLVLEAGADVNMVSQAEDNASLLMLATLNEANDELVRTILNHGPSLDLRDRHGKTVLNRINNTTSDHTVKMIVRCGGHLDVTDDMRQTPLIASILTGNIFVFNFLMTQDIVKSSLNAPSNYGTALHHAIDVGNGEMVESLIESGADIDFPMGGITGTPIMTAILRQQEAIAETLLSHGAQLTRPAGFFSLPLLVASLTASPRFLRTLLEKTDSGVSKDVADSFGRRPVHLACYNGLDVLNELEVPDKDFTVKDCVGRVPLHYAALTGDVDLVQAAITRSKRVGVDINVKDDDGWTPLLWASRFCDTIRSGWSRRMHQDVVEHLIAQGADPGVTVQGVKVGEDDDRWTAADVAQYHQVNAVVVNLLREKAAAAGQDAARTQKSGDPVSSFCDCCLAEIYGVYLTCMDCEHVNFNLCFKCSRVKDQIHAPTHRLIQHGGDWSPQPSSEIAASEGEHSAHEGFVLEQPMYELDDEIVDLGAIETPPADAAVA